MMTTIVVSRFSPVCRSRFRTTEVSPTLRSSRSAGGSVCAGQAVAQDSANVDSANIANPPRSMDESMLASSHPPPAQREWYQPGFPDERRNRRWMVAIFGATQKVLPPFPAATRSTNTERLSDGSSAGGCGASSAPCYGAEIGRTSRDETGGEEAHDRKVARGFARRGRTAHIRCAGADARDRGRDPDRRHRPRSD